MRVDFSRTDNPDGLLGLVECLPGEFGADDEITIVFPHEYLYSCVFPVMAAWSKRVPEGTSVKLDLAQCEESARRLVHNVGLVDIVESEYESPKMTFKGASNVPLQPVVVGRSTDEALDRVHRMVDEWAGYLHDTSAFRTILSELAENILVHSAAESPGYVHARVHRGAYGEKCEITFADSGIGILHSYLDGANEDVKSRIKAGASSVKIALDGLSSSKPKEVSPGGRSYFGLGLYTVKKLMEYNRGRMTVISGSEYVTLDGYREAADSLDGYWQGTIVSLVVDLGNPLPLERVYEEEVSRIVPTQTSSTKQAGGVSANSGALRPEQAQAPAGGGRVGAKQLVMKEIGPQLLSRETGLAARAELATLLADGAIVEVDLDGVEDITPSVADECFGKLAQRLGEEKFKARVLLRGGSTVLHRLIEFVVAIRLKRQEDDPGTPKAPK